MSKSIKILLFSTVLVVLVLPVFLINVQAADWETRIDPFLRQMLENSPENEMIPVYIMINDRLSLESLQSQTRGMDKKERRATVVRMLKEHAARTQRNVAPALESARSRGDIGHV